MRKARGRAEDSLNGAINACGAPVLGSATPPVQEMIRDGENGWLFGFFDRDEMVEKAVAALSMDTGPITAAARRLVEERFSFSDHSLPAYLSLWQELVA